MLVGGVEEWGGSRGGDGGGDGGGWWRRKGGGGGGGGRWSPNNRERGVVVLLTSHRRTWKFIQTKWAITHADDANPGTTAAAPEKTETNEEDISLPFLLDIATAREIGDPKRASCHLDDVDVRLGYLADRNSPEAILWGEGNIFSGGGEAVGFGKPDILKLSSKVGVLKLHMSKGEGQGGGGWGRRGGGGEEGGRGEEGEGGREGEGKRGILDAGGGNFRIPTLEFNFGLYLTSQAAAGRSSGLSAEMSSVQSAADLAVLQQSSCMRHYNETDLRPELAKIGRNILAGLLEEPNFQAMVVQEGETQLQAGGLAERDVLQRSVVGHMLGADKVGTDGAHVMNPVLVRDGDRIHGVRTYGPRQLHAVHPDCRSINPIQTTLLRAEVGSTRAMKTPLSRTRDLV